MYWKKLLYRDLWILLIRNNKIRVWYLIGWKLYCSDKYYVYEYSEGTSQTEDVEEMWKVGWWFTKWWAGFGANPRQVVQTECWRNWHGFFFHFRKMTTAVLKERQSLNPRFEQLQQKQEALFDRVTSNYTAMWLKVRAGTKACTSGQVINK